jgi:hypothetical protein
MDDEAESSRAGQRHDDEAPAPEHHDTELDDVLDAVDEEAEAAELQKELKERRVDAKRKRVKFLDHLLRELDTLVFLELITLYHLEYDYLIFTSTEILGPLTISAVPSSGSRFAR